MVYVVLLVRGQRIDHAVDVGRIPGRGTEEQFAAARADALKRYPNGNILGVY